MCNGTLPNWMIWPLKNPKPQSSASQTPNPTPVAAPTPQTINPSEVEGRATEAERRQKLARMRNGLASTIKTSAKGLTGSGSDLLTQTIMGKDKLGA